LEVKNIIPIIISGLVAVISIFGYSVFGIFLPKIEDKIFEQLIQVNATVLGFTIVGIFYYLGRTNDMKRDQLEMIKELTDKFKSKSRNTTEVSKFVTELEATVDSNKKLFDEVRNVIRFYSIIIISHYAVGIALSFIPLLLSEIENKMAWIFFILTTELILSTVYFYICFWQSLGDVDKAIYNTINEYIKKLPKL